MSFRNWLAKKVGDFAIERIADKEYSQNLKTVIALGEAMWRVGAENQEHLNERS